MRVKSLSNGGDHNSTMVQCGRVKSLSGQDIQGVVMVFAVTIFGAGALYALAVVAHLRTEEGDSNECKGWGRSPECC